MRRLLIQFRSWDRPSQVGFILALLLLVPTALIANNGPEDLRQPALIGLFGLVITAQVIFMYANRGMLTPFSKAQRLYRNGDLDGARKILESLYPGGDVQALTLLGNTYRQLGRLEESEQVLFEARNKHPDHYFPLYGLGRTLLVQGRYAEAAAMIEQALEHGAPPVVAADAGEAHYYAGNTAAAQAHLTAVQPEEPHRALMTAHLLYRLGAGEPPDAALVAAGLPFWEAQMRRFQQTPYGHALADDIRVMKES